MARRRVAAIVKIQLPAGAATPAPPVGTALGPHGVQTMEFCKQYNAATENQRGHDHPRRDHDLRGPVVHLRAEDAADDRPHPGGGGRREGEQRSPGASPPARSPTTRSPRSPQKKMPDLNANDLEAAKRQVAGTARSMGITVSK